MTYESVATRDQQAKEEPPWWIINMKIYNGKSLSIVPLDLTIFSDTSRKGWVFRVKGSLLFIKHGRNPEQIFNRNLEGNLGLYHREENTFDSRIYTQSEQSNSRLGISKFPGQQRMENLPNCFQTNLQSFREIIAGPFCFQTLPPTATIHSLVTRPSKCHNKCISTGLKIAVSVCFSTTLNDRKGIKES